MKPLVYFSQSLNCLFNRASSRFSRKIPKIRNRHFLLLDILVFLLTPIIVLSLRLESFSDFEPYRSGLLLETLLFLTIKLSVLWAAGFYKRYWRHASIDELLYITTLMLITGILQTIIYQSLYPLANGYFESLPRSVPFLDALFSFLIIGGLRFSIRAVFRSKPRKEGFKRSRVLIVGAGSAGVSLAKELQNNPDLGLCPVAFIDDDPRKIGLAVVGLKVLGDRSKMPELVKSLGIQRIIIAIPSAPGNVIRDFVDIAQKTGVLTSTLPGIHEVLNGQVQASAIRDIKIEDLLRREPIKTDVAKVQELLKSKRVLITGAGGSIGSELCRQILKCHPTEILLLGKGENSIFKIQQELEELIQTLQKEDIEANRKTSLPRLTVFIADIRSLPRLDYAFSQFRPEVIFHAAAHKHVPLMELNAPEAITSNVIGTKNLLDMAKRYNVGHFVMISTDKAVNPTNVMGASKRVAEMLVLNAAKMTGKPYVVVRFGNVLGSRGSVVPTFQRQIAAGGPITVTHPDICRYFMTIPEAVQLVLQAAVLSLGGEVMMLDMGQPVKIVDLAKDLIHLSGYEVGKDINIVFTGLRPGEKLFEELFVKGEEYVQTQHDKILIVYNSSNNIPKNLYSFVDSLSKATAQNDSQLILFLLEQLVSGYVPKYPKNEAKSNKKQEVSVGSIPNQ